jgi:hypothetical protein
MPGKPFQSKLEPFYEFIAKGRRKRITWAQIAELITTKGTPCTRQGVQDFFKRKRKRRYAMGMEPEDGPIKAIKESAPIEALRARSKANQSSQSSEDS